MLLMLLLILALELLLGRYPAADLQARQGLPVMPGPIPAGLPLQMLERRPDMTDQSAVRPTVPAACA